ncbi:MAG: hypothetical protein RX318_07620 [bacterium]|nr:hypothetical protein [bacterium]
MSLITKVKKFAKKRTKEFKALADIDLTPDAAEAEIAGQKVTFRINVERQAAWKLYVELNTRITTQPLKGSEGFLREALSSLHAVFGITREILKEAGPEVAEDDESLGFYAMEILNQVLRPVLTKWHPALSYWEEQRDPKVSPIEHEQKWKDAKALRRELNATRKTLLGYCEALAILAGVSTETKGA